MPEQPASSRKLPEYTKPPVSEVALSVAFEPLEGYTAAHAGLFWSEVSDRFPKVEEHPPIEIPIENDALGPAPEPKLELLTAFPRPRLWFLTDAKDEILQVQAEGFFRNWRQVTGQEEYPRYEKLAASFVQDFRKFEQFVDKTSLGSIAPTRCEVVYVNHILSGDGWSQFGEMHKVIAGCAPLRQDTFLTTPEECRYAAKFPIRDPKSGQFLGRLTCAASPAFRRSDRRPLISLILTARGKPLGVGLQGVTDFFALAHEWIVQGFTDLTTAEMHGIWGRTR